MPLGLLAPYAPALDDIFDSGSMNINIDDLTDEKQRKIRIAVTLLSDCRIKSADEILAPAIQAALQTLDQSALPDVHELKGKIERLKLSTESLRTELEGVAKIVDTLKALAPRDVREKYDKYKNQYDRAKKSYDEWDTKFAALLKDLDRVKVGIVEDTFQHFIKSGTPIEVDIQEVEGEWQFDAYETVVRLVEKNYRTILTGEYQKRIQELRDAVDKLSIL
jgi:nucleotide-binding universal stress UspA family protein